MEKPCKKIKGSRKYYGGFQFHSHKEKLLIPLVIYLFDFKWVILKLYKGLCDVIPDKTVEINLRLKST